MDSPWEWCLIKNDSGVFTELMKKLGVKGAQVEELWTIDEGIFENLRPVHGLIFLCEYIEEVEPTAPIVTDDRLLNIFFAKQVTNNACATQAIISLLLNCNHPDIQLGPDLTALKELSMPFDPMMRGLTLSNSLTIRLAHNSMSQQTFCECHSNRSKEEDAYHFIGYIPIHGRLYELDGLRDGPIDHGPIHPGQDWLDIVRPIILKRTYDIYAEGVFNVNLMALVSNRKMVYERQIDELINDNNMHDMDCEDTENEIRKLQMLIEYEDIKMYRYRRDILTKKVRSQLHI